MGEPAAAPHPQHCTKGQGPNGVYQRRIACAKSFVLARIWGEVDLEKLGNKLRPELHIQSVRNVCDNFPESIITAQ